jgi:simple sugar transport system ATP-binding protein
VVLRYIAQAKARNLGVIFITHNVHHAFPVGDSFTMLNRGRTLGTFRKGEVSREEILEMMSGGRELKELGAELEEFARADQAPGGRSEAGAAAEHAFAEAIDKEYKSVHH